MTDCSVLKRHGISEISSSAYSPQECGCHGLTNSLGVSLFVNDPKFFGVDAQEQLDDTLPRKARLYINNDAVIQHLAMRSMVQFAIGPQPKRRSTMRHFLSIPLPGDIGTSPTDRCEYCEHRGASIHSYKRYRSNVLANGSLCVGSSLKVVRRASGVFSG